MERKIPGPVFLHLIFFACLAPTSVATSGLNISKVVHFQSMIHWSNAQKYCKTHYTDLATIRNEHENSRFPMLGGWIGLNKLSGPWRWNGETPEYFNWDSGEPGRGYCARRSLNSTKWKECYCYHEHEFFCMDKRVILVQEMKTWEEAVQHCRGLQHTGAAQATYLYDLVSLPEPRSFLLYGDTTGLNENTNEVWIGLRFLAGKWLWMNSRKVTSSYLPPCPAQRQHCGALVFNSTQWKILNCSERRKFLCSYVV